MLSSKYAKQSGGRGQYGHCKVKFEPMDAKRRRDYSNSNLPLSVVLFLRNTSQQLVKVSKKLLRLVSLADSQFLVFTLTYTMDLTMRSTLLKWHSTLLDLWHSKRLWQKLHQYLLEPIMKVEVTMPEEYMGDVIGDINSRRGRIEGMDDIGGGKMVKAYVPLAEMFGYSTDLRSKTQGRGNYSMFFEKYEPVPKSVQEKVLADKSK